MVIRSVSSEFKAAGNAPADTKPKSLAPGQKPYVRSSAVENRESFPVGTPGRFPSSGTILAKHKQEGHKQDGIALKPGVSDFHERNSMHMMLPAGKRGVGMNIGFPNVCLTPTDMPSVNNGAIFDQEQKMLQTNQNLEVATDVIKPGA
jgi:hypothetical protein